jgi:ABC-type bacteriocin/lantibiotic exporter with double-glycine peptidase domain
VSARSRRIRVPFYPQSSPIDCGPSCLASILRYYGFSINATQLTDLCNVGRGGVSARSLATAASTFGLLLVARSLELTDLCLMPVPSILQWNFNHWVVLEGTTSSSIVIVDPARGRRIVSWNEASTSFTGIGLLADPRNLKRNHSIPPPPTFRSYLHKLHIRLPTALWFVGALTLCTISSQLLGVALAKLSGSLFSIITLLNRNLLWRLTIGMSALVLGKIFLEQVRSLFIIRLRAVLDGTLLLSILRSLFKLPFSFFLSRGAGEMGSRIQNYFFLRQLITDQIAALLIDILFAGIYAFALAKIDISTLLIVAVVATASFAVAFFRYGKERDLWAAELEADSQKSRALFEILRSAKRVKAGGFENQLLDRWQNLLNRHVNASTSRSFGSVLWDGIGQFLQQILPVLILVRGAALVLEHRMQIGSIFTELFLAGGLLTPLSSLVRTAQQLRIATVYWDRIAELLQAPEERSNGQEIPLNGILELRNLCFRYPGESEDALNSVSFSVRRGTLTAIVGTSGSGKSTLVSLILGLYQPASGDVLFNGISLAELNLSHVRQQIGVVLQDESTFEGSVLANILLSHPDRSLADVVEAARTAQIHESIMLMPAQYETYVSEDGRNLSGGQRQRLALARALVNKPVLLLLDEATSNLDLETASVVEHALAALSCTRIVVTHKLSAIQHADQIIVMEKGKIVEVGKHDHLLLSRGAYFSLYTSGRDDLKEAHTTR